MIAWVLLALSAYSTHALEGRGTTRPPVYHLIVGLERSADYQVQVDGIVVDTLRVDREGTLAFRASVAHPIRLSRFTAPR